MLEGSRGQARDTPAYSHLLGSWVAAIGLAASVGIVYFLAARLSLALLTTPDGVAAFWPAAGIAAGTIVALGSPARVPVAIGVVAATILANLTGDTYCNQAAVDLWERRPELGKDKWSDLWRLYYPDGTSMPLDDRPTQIVLNGGPSRSRSGGAP